MRLEHRYYKAVVFEVFTADFDFLFRVSVGEYVLAAYVNSAQGISCSFVGRFVASERKNDTVILFRSVKLQSAPCIGSVTYLGKWVEILGHIWTNREIFVENISEPFNLFNFLIVAGEALSECCAVRASDLVCVEVFACTGT